MSATVQSTGRWLLVATVAVTATVLSLLLLAIPAISAPDEGQPAPGMVGSDGPGSVEGTTIFTDTSALAGITTPVQLQHMPGQAWADYNQDGWLDLYLTGGINASVLHRNNGDGTFSVSPVSSAVAVTNGPTGGAAWGDYDNDGYPDLYVLVNSENTSNPNRLFHNDGGTGFTDVTVSAGVGDLGVGTTGSWGDYDGDGYLDLYVTNWFCNLCPNGTRDTLYHNNGDGTFTDVSDALGVATLGPGFVASWLDYDNDGDLDIYLVNDKAFSGPPPPPHPGHNILWRNDGAGCGPLAWCFTDVSVSSGANIPVDGMGLAIGDYDNDGDLDMYFSNAGPQVLLQNQTSQGNPTFLNVGVAAGVAFDAVGWSAVFFDYDNDTLLDLYLATMNGEPQLANRVYHNDGDGTFTDVSDGSGANNNGQTLGAAYADYDEDGHVDLVIGNLGVPYTLYRNLGLAEGGSNNWLSVELRGGGPVNRDAIGGRVVLSTSDGDTLMQEVKSGSSLGSNNQLALHFGLGSQSVNDLSIKWSNGVTETLGAVSVNQMLTIEYPQPASCSDVTGDDLVSVLDVQAIAERWNQVCPAPDYALLYDLNADRIVDVLDIMLAAGDLGQNCP